MQGLKNQELIGIYFVFKDSGFPKQIKLPHYATVGYY